MKKQADLKSKAWFRIVTIIVFLAGLALVSFEARIIISRLKYVNKYRQFEKNGEISIATVLEKGVLTPEVLNARYIRYGYKDNENKKHISQEIVSNRIYERLNKGEEFFVLFDPVNTEYSMVLGSGGSCEERNRIAFPLLMGFFLVFVALVLNWG